MANAPWSQGDIDTLRAAIGSGILTIRFDGPPGRTITYQSIPDMSKALARMLAENAAAAGGKSYRLASTKKGFDP